MTRERLYLYDTTLRDGQQTQGVQFSTAEKIAIAQMLDALGVDYIEGGWPGANPTDSAFFEAAPRTRARLTAFGMTKRAGRSAANDDVLAAVMNAGTGAVCLVGKEQVFHVTTALGVSLDENLENIAASIVHLVAQGREALFDAEHFIDGSPARSSQQASPATVWAPTPIMTPKPPWPAALPRLTPARGRCRARSTAWASAAAMPT